MGHYINVTEREKRFPLSESNKTLMNTREVFVGEVMMACGLKLHENATYIMNLEGKLLKSMWC